MWQVCQGNPHECTQRMLSKLWEPRHHAAVHSAVWLAVYGGSAVAEVWDRFGMKTPPSTQSHRQTKTIRKSIKGAAKPKKESHQFRPSFLKTYQVFNPWDFQIKKEHEALLDKYNK